MKKRFHFISILACLITQNAWAGFLLHYQNKDSKRYNAAVKCQGGSRSAASFGGGTTGSVQIQGSAPCQISLKNSVTVKEGAYLMIQDESLSLK